MSLILTGGTISGGTRNLLTDQNGILQVALNSSGDTTFGVNSNTKDGAGNPLTSTATGSHQALDVNVVGTNLVTNAGTFAVQNTAAVVGGNSVAVKVDGSSVTQPVSGTVNAIINGTPNVTIAGSIPSHPVTNAGTFAVQNTAAVIGGNATAVKVDGSAVTQPVSGSVSITGTPAVTATISGTPSITGSVTANAGTNLNTSALALETGGNLATIATNTAKIPSKGSATMANSTPVNIASDQTVPVSLASIPSHAVTNAGTFAVQNTAAVIGGNATAVKVDGSAVTQPVSLASVPSHAVTNAGTFAVQNTAAVIGGNATAVKVDGSAVIQPVSGTITANAGTNLNTSALARETGGNLSTIATAVRSVAGFNIPAHDYMSLSYTGSNLTGVIYMTGGSSGTTVGTLTLAYDGSNNLTSITLS